jgi:hypothetical protein
MTRGGENFIGNRRQGDGQITRVTAGDPTATHRSVDLDDEDVAVLQVKAGTDRGELHRRTRA